MIQWMHDNLWLSRIIWFSLGVIGAILLRTANKEFYENKPKLWYLICGLYYLVIGPATFLFGLIHISVYLARKRRTNAN